MNPAATDTPELYVIPGDYEQRRGLPLPHEPVCPLKRRDPKYSYLSNPCGRALDHDGACEPMSSIQWTRRRHYRIGQAALDRRRIAEQCQSKAFRVAGDDASEDVCVECEGRRWEHRGR